MLIRVIITAMMLTTVIHVYNAQTKEKSKEQPLIFSSMPPSKPTENPEAVKYRNAGIDFAVKLENEKAIAEFNKAIELDPNFADAYSRRGAAYSNKGDYDRAIEDFNKAIELDSKHDIALLNRASLNLIKEDYRAAIIDFSKLIKLFPESGIYYSLRADAYVKIGRKDLAAADLKKVKELREKEGQ